MKDMQWGNIVILAIWSGAFGVWQNSFAAAAFAFLTPTVAIIVKECVKEWKE